MKQKLVILMSCLLAGVVVGAFIYSLKTPANDIPLPPEAYDIQLDQTWINTHTFRAGLTPDQIVEFYQEAARDAGWNTCWKQDSKFCLTADDRTVSCLLGFEPLRIERYTRRSGAGYLIIIVKAYNLERQESTVEIWSTHEWSVGCAID
jgi:hypothetical protein